MSEIASPYILIKRLEAEILRLLSYIDTSDLSVGQQQSFASLKHGLVDARLEIQDYELAETRDDQLRNAKDSRQQLEAIQQLIVDDPAHIFGPVDVAHFSAQIGQISGKIK